MPYTHSLSSALAWALAAAFICWTLLPKDNARSRITAVVGMTVLSHWLLDLLVHMPDLPLWFDSVKVGLGWWNYRLFALLLELALLWMGIVWCLPLAGGYSKRYLLLGLAMSGVQVYSLLEQPDNGTAAAQQLLLTYLVLAGAGWWMHPVRFRSVRTT